MDERDQHEHHAGQHGQGERERPEPTQGSAPRRQQGHEHERGHQPGDGEVGAEGQQDEVAHGGEPRARDPGDLVRLQAGRGAEDDGDQQRRGGGDGPGDHGAPTAPEQERHGVGDGHEEGEEVESHEEGAGEGVGDPPARPPLLGAQQQPGRQEREGRDQRGRAGLLRVEGDRGVDREEQGGEEADRHRGEPGPDDPEQPGRGRHGEHGRHPGPHLAPAEEEPAVQQRVVDGVHGLDPGEHRPQLGKAAVGGDQRGGLVAPHRVPVEAEEAQAHHHQDRDPEDRTHHARWRGVGRLRVDRPGADLRRRPPERHDRHGQTVAAAAGGRRICAHA